MLPPTISTTPNSPIVCAKVSAAAEISPGQASGSSIVRKVRQCDRPLHHAASRISGAIASKPRSIHPAVWTRASGEKVFHMTPYGCQGIEGEESPAAFALLAEIWDEAMRVIKPYYHQWHETDMVIWDNWRVLHEACGCNPDEERVVHRTTIKGDYGLGRFEQKPELTQA